MPLTTLDLDPLYLTYLTEKLRLNVTSSADFRVPDVALHQLALSKALESGVVWVGSTRVIRLSIHIFFNDRHLDTEERARILEPLGNCILNSKLWCQLSLSPSLEIPSFDNANTAQADLSILLDQYSPTTASVPQPRGWILDNLDVHVPPSVLSVQFEKLHVNLKFSSLQEQCLSASKRLKIHEEDTYSTLPDPPTDETEAHLEKLEEAVDKLAHRLPSLMAKCLGLPEASSPTYFTESDPNALPASTILYRQPSKSLNTTHQLPTDAKNKLRVWLDKHLDNPYPTREEKLHLMQQSGLQWKQVERWFIKSRRSLARCTKDKDHEDEMLLQSLDNSRQVRQSPAVCTREAASQSKQPSPPSGQWRSGDQDYVPVLLDSETPSLPSELSTQISMTCFSSYGSQKRPVSPTFNDAISRELSLLCSHMLVLATLNILIGGTSCKRSLQHVALESAFPETSLSNLAPALFRPGFKQLMAHNSRFLPSILCAISSSWVRNCQGPGLRATLIELSNSTPPVSDYGNIAEAGVQGSVERLSAVVQGRMWRMMHKKLSDAAICRKITWESVDPTRIIDAEDAVTDEDLLGSRRAEGQKGIYLSPGKDLQECITDGYIDGDDLLLFDAMSDDEGLLSYFDEMEKLEVEKQTDEMLFGSENCEDEGDSEIVLLLDGDAEDTMLL